MFKPNEKPSTKQNPDDNKDPKQPARAAANPAPEDPAPAPAAPADEPAAPAEDAAPVPTPAQVAAKAKADPDAPKDKVLFVSERLELKDTIVRAGGKAFKPRFDRGGKFLIWYVDKDVASSFEKHALVKTRKILKAIS